MNPALTALVLARQTTVRLLRARMPWLLLLGAIAGAVLVALIGRHIARHNRGDVALGVITWLTYMQFVLPFCALWFGVQAVQGDIEDRTSVYLFSRPLSRPAMLLGKWFAAALVSALLILLGIGILYVALTWDRSRTWQLGVRPPAAMLPAFAHAGVLGALAYAALGALFGAWFKRPLIMGLVFLVGWEGMMANLPAHASARALTVVDAVRRLLWQAHAPRDDYAEVLLGPMMVHPDPNALDPSLALLRFAVLAGALAAWVYARREYDARVAE
ncbi:MAG TPA: ABC transporter permease subunit [Planctomycetota bacterium]|nr:ABC transporter permease subunit [Planctomycetota bacterium]